jgi:PAS domain S-box-containing protein
VTDLPSSEPSSAISPDVTARRAAELRLELSEQSLRLATDAAEVGTWDLDLATDVLNWSDRTKAMFGISPDVACSMADFYAGLHPEDVERTSAAFASALDPTVRATYDVEYRTVGKEDGVVRWVAAKGKGLFKGDVCHRAVGTAIDITARRIAQANKAFQLELSDRLRSLTEPRAIMEAAVQALGQHLVANRVGYGQVQADNETVLLVTDHAVGVRPLAGMFPLNAFGADNMADQRRGLTLVCNDVLADSSNNPETWAAIDTRAFVSVPLIRDGRLRASLFVNQRDPRAWSAGDVALIEDVAARTWDSAERARAEAELRASEGRLREANAMLEQRVMGGHAELAMAHRERDRIFEMSRDLFAVATFEGYLKSINPAWSRQLGRSDEELLAKPFSEIVHPDDLAVTASVVAALQRGEAVQGFRVRLLKADGEPIAFAWSAVPEAKSGGGIFYSVGRDITEETKAAAELQATQEALRQAQKMEAVGQLTGGIAHDFNNLLAGITGSLELLQRRVATGRTDGLERYTSAAVTSAQRAAALTQRLLAFARRQPLDPKRVEANRLVAGMEDLLRRTLGPGVDLEMVLAGGLWPTLCDANQLESAILNLAINARDAMPSGGRLTVETANAHLDDAYARAQGGEIRPGQYIAISVTDTGTGMPPDVIAKAFDPFFTTKPIGQGTGLGLSMLYGFVKQSEGHVRIYSELGKGTTFKLYLPRHVGRADDDEASRETSETPRAETGETVLVVEDEAIVRMLVTETLEELGYAAIEAPDGPSGLRILQSNVRIDLLVTDVGLPGLNGRQLADAARVSRPDLRVLFLTGYAHNAAIGNGAVLGTGMELMTKPFALDALATKIRALIEND